MKTQTYQEYLLIKDLKKATNDPEQAYYRLLLLIAMEPVAVKNFTRER